MLFFVFLPNLSSITALHLFIPFRLPSRYITCYFSFLCLPPLVITYQNYTLQEEQRGKWHCIWCTEDRFSLAISILFSLWCVVCLSHCKLENVPDLSAFPFILTFVLVFLPSESRISPLSFIFALFLVFLNDYIKHHFSLPLSYPLRLIIVLLLLIFFHFLIISLPY